MYGFWSYQKVRFWIKVQIISYNDSETSSNVLIFLETRYKNLKHKQSLYLVLYCNIMIVFSKTNDQSPALSSMYKAHTKIMHDTQNHCSLDNKSSTRNVWTWRYLHEAEIMYSFYRNKTSAHQHTAAHSHTSHFSLYSLTKMESIQDPLC